MQKKINGEIINADSMQVYKQIKILSARPNPKNYQKVRHHLYGFHDIKKNFSTGDWLKLVIKKIDEVKKRIEASDIDYFDNPYRRFIGSKFEQETFFVEDPNGNVLEIKTMSNPEVLFETAS